MWLSRLRSRKVLAAAAAVVLLGVGAATSAFGQTGPPIRRAQPVNETPVPRALPVEPPASPNASRPVPNNGAAPTDTPSTAGSGEGERSDRRQLQSATGLFGRKLYDLAAPEFEKYLDQYPDAPGRAQAQFFLGESYRALNRMS